MYMMHTTHIMIHAHIFQIENSKIFEILINSVMKFTTYTHDTHNAYHTVEHLQIFVILNSVIVTNTIKTRNLFILGLFILKPICVLF